MGRNEFGLLSNYVIPELLQAVEEGWCGKDERARVTVRLSKTAKDKTWT